MALRARKPRTPAQRRVTARLVALNKKRAAEIQLKKKPARTRKAKANPAWPQRWVLRMMVKGKPWYYRGLEKFSDHHRYAIEFGTFTSAVGMAEEITSRFKLPARLEVIKAQLLSDRHDNPVPPSSRARLKEAARRFEDFTGHRAEAIDVHDLPITDTAFRIGQCDGILYTTMRDGKKESYIHKFKNKARPLLCSSYDGRQLLLLGGGFQFTERGIVDD